MPPLRVDRDLLFGILALQMDLIDREALAVALGTCADDRTRTLGQVLTGRGDLTAETRDLLGGLVGKHLERHGDDPVRSLAAPDAMARLRADLERRAEPARRIERTRVAPAHGPDGDPNATLDPEPAGTVGGPSTSPQTLDDGATPADRGSATAGFGSLTTQAGPSATAVGEPQPPSEPTESSAFGSSLTPADPYATRVEGLRPTPADPHATSAGGVGTPQADPHATSPPTEVDPYATSVPAGATGSVVPTDVDPHATSAEAISPGTSGGCGGPAASFTPGRFRVLRHHARGGLGAVYVARDEELGRDVALKEIQDRHADHPTSRLRFLLEAEVTGGLEHPGIVPVYSLGRHLDGRPYYAMRFIRGDSLKKAIELFHQAEGPGRDPLTPNHERRCPRQGTVDGGRWQRGRKGDRCLLLSRVVLSCLRLPTVHRPPSTVPCRGHRRSSLVHHPLESRALEFRGLLGRFLSVCNAIEYAHYRGVIHRDIKPENVMLGPFGETLVVDWGLAKALDRPDLGAEAVEAPLRPPSASGSSATIVGSALGTPAFMSPEQAAGQVDRMGPAADIYSLGATLYAVLTGRAPFGEPDLHTVLEKVKRGEFVPPRQVKADVSPALEAICLKAMALRPEDRYPSARGLADDLEHWLADEPVSVYREPWPVRFARWRRRHRATVSAAAALLIAAVVALSIGSALVWREQQRTRAQFLRAEANFQAALDAVDQMLTQVGDEDLADVPHLEAVRNRLLARARDFYQDFLLKQKGSDPAVRRETGRAHRRVADIQEMLGRSAEAEPSYRRAIGIQEELVRDHPGAAESRRDLALSRNNLAILLKTLNRFPDAEAAFRDALELRAELVRARPRDPDRRRDLAVSRYHLGALLARLQGRREDAARAYDAALAVQRQLLAEFPGEPADRRELARYLNNLGLLCKGSGRLRDAEQTFSEAIAIQKDLAATFPRVPGYRRRLAQIQNNLGTLQERADPKKAEAVYREAVRLARELVADFPSVPDYQQELAGFLNNLGRLLVLTNQPNEARDAFQEAEAALRKAIAIREQLVGEFPQRPDYRHKLALVRLNLGAFLRGKGQTPAAEALFDGSRDALEALVARFPTVPEYRRDLGRVLSTSALVLIERNDLEPARERLARALDLHESALSACPQDRTYLDPLHDDHFALADLLLRLGRHAEAAAHVEELTRTSPDDALEYVKSAVFLMRGLRAAAVDSGLPEPKRREAGRAYARRAVELLREAAQKGFDRPDLLKSTVFEPLHGTDDFQELLKDLEAKTWPVAS